jgi:PD-(D/E)XK endonuclease
MKNIPRHPKLRGEWAEVHFLARACELGLRVSKPYGDCLPYDFIVEHRGRMFRVQVKSTSYQSPGYTGYKCFVKPTKGKRYAADMIDFIAAYVLPEDVWYIIPFSEVTGASTVRLDPRNSRNRYRRYREAWDLLLAQVPMGPAPSHKE